MSVIRRTHISTNRTGCAGEARIRAETNRNGRIASRPESAWAQWPEFRHETKNPSARGLGLSVLLVSGETGAKQMTPLYAERSCATRRTLRGEKLRDAPRDPIRIGQHSFHQRWVIGHRHIGHR